MLIMAKNVIKQFMNHGFSWVVHINPYRKWTNMTMMTIPHGKLPAMSWPVRPWFIPWHPDFLPYKVAISIWNINHYIYIHWFSLFWVVSNHIIHLIIWQTYFEWFISSNWNIYKPLKTTSNLYDVICIQHSGTRFTANPSQLTYRYSLVMFSVAHRCDDIIT